MGKRRTGLGKTRRTHSHKTKKRLAIKQARLAALAARRHKKY